MAGDKIRALLVGGSPEDARRTREALAASRDGSFELGHAPRLAAGLERLRTDTFGIVLLDLHLSDGGGLCALNALRAAAPQVPVLALVGREDERLGLEAVRTGAQHYLGKEVLDGGLLAEAIQHAIERQAMLLKLSQAARNAETREANLRKIIARNADGIVILDPEGTVLFVNPAAEEIFGREARQIVGGQFGCPVVGGETAELNIGPDRVAQMRAVDIDWQGAPAHLVSLRDVTEQRKTDEALRKSEEIFRAVFEKAKDPIFVKDPSCR
jgi:PAS domain-containing protein